MTQPRWLALAWADLGVAEVAGANNNARVVRYYADVGQAQIKDDETAWCAAFLGSCLERAGLASTHSLMARSYLAWGDALDDFRPGAIAVLSRTADPALGHVGFLIGETDSDVILLGGNQSDAVTVEAFPRARLLGLRWPTSAAGEGSTSPRPAVPATGSSGSPVIPDGASSPPPVIPEAERSEAVRHPAASDALFARALAHVLEMEGGWTDDPYDPGGPTNFGITLATYARDKGVEVTASTIGALKSDLRSIPEETVRRIYYERYWLPATCLQMPPALAFFHFDAAVNQGVTGSARLLQEAVGTEIDGEIGPETLGKAAARPIEDTLALYAEARRRHYRSLATYWRFGRGWLARVDRTLAAAIAIATDFAPDVRQPSDQLQPKETPAMTDTTPSATAPDTPATKWWGKSMTIWGVIITTLSTVLPAFGPVFGLNLTADLIQQLGDQIVQVAQALGGLVGTILTIWGRARATTLLERRQVTMNL